MKSFNEKRKIERYHFNIPIIYKKSINDSWNKTFTNNINSDGMHFTTKDNKITKGSKLKICIQYPDKHIDNFPVLQTKVIWTSYEIKNNIKFKNIAVKIIRKNPDIKSYLKQVIKKFEDYHNHLNSLEENKDYKILYIEDNASLTKLFTLLSKEYNFNGFIASTLEESLRIVRDEKPNIILTDIHIPNFNIFTLITKLKTNDNYKDIPIIGCSVTYPETGNKFLLLGGNKFVSDKPSSLETLNKILKGIAPGLQAKGYPLLE